MPSFHSGKIETRRVYAGLLVYTKEQNATKQRVDVYPKEGGALNRLHGRTDLRCRRRCLKDLTTFKESAMRLAKNLSPSLFSHREAVGRKTIIILLTVCFLLWASPAPAQEVIESYDLGNNIEDLTYISGGDLAGKFAFCDGWRVYTLDLDTHGYEELFYYGESPLGIPGRGITYIGAGDYADHFLINDPVHPDTLYIFSTTGTLAAEVDASDIPWYRHCEGLTYIDSGPHQGRFAMNLFDNDWLQYLTIFSIANEGGNIRTYHKKDITGAELGDFPLGLTFLPSDYPDPAYQNHFVIADLNPDDWENPVLYLRVLDDQGNLKARFPAADEAYEGLAYITNGAHQGKFIASTHHARDVRLRDLEGTINQDIHQDVMSGLGLMAPLTMNWREQTNEFLVDDFRAGLFKTFTRNGPDDWSLTGEIPYPELAQIRGVTGLTPNGKHYIVGYNGHEWVEGVGNVRKYEVHQTDANFQLEAVYPLYTDYLGDWFSRIRYIPGATPAEDRLALAQYFNQFGEDEDNIYYFDIDFSGPPEIVPFPAGAMNFATDFFYDADNLRYYTLEQGNTIRVYTASRQFLDQWDVSAPVRRNFSSMVRISSGDLAGNLGLFNGDDNELVIINIEPIISPVTAVDPQGNAVPAATIQEAVDMAGQGWIVEVGAGAYDESITVSDKTGLTIITSLGAEVKGFKFLQSDNIVVEGFAVDASGTGAHGLALPGGISGSGNITISNCDIHSAGPAYSGIKVGTNCPNVTIENCHIHHNGRNGILYENAVGGPHFVNNNLIEWNGRNGVQVAYHHEITLTGNTICYNGTNSGSTGGRYGILRMPVTGGGFPEEIILIDNQIFDNNGKTVSGKSSLDLGNYHQTLDAGDSGNCTTCGCEGTGVGSCD